MIIRDFSLVLVTLVFFVSGFASAGDVQLTSDGKVPGKPFENLQQQVDSLKQQITDIQVGDLNHETRMVYYENIEVEPGDNTWICADAPLGKHVVGGGGEIAGDELLSADALTMFASVPRDGNCIDEDYTYNESMDFWCVYWRNNTNQKWTGTIYAYIISVGEEYPGPFLGCR